MRYAVDEQPPHLLAAALGLQVVVLIIAGIVLTPTIVLRAAGDPGGFLPWAVFAGLLVCGLTTIVQARPVWRFGAGYVLFMGTSGAFIAISIDAVEAGGVPLLATLVVGSALIQFLFSHRLSLLRRVVTPTVGGTVIMLIAVTVIPIAYKLLNGPMQGVAEQSPAGPIVASVTFCVILGVSLFFKGSVRLWGPIAGVLVGSIVAFGFGAYDVSEVGKAAWIGLPEKGWPGLDLSFGADFWWLLVPFCIVTVVGALETYGDGIAIQRLSRRTRDPIDFRSVQGAVNADGLGNLLSGLAGTLPNTTYSTSLSVVDLTGVGSRLVGIYGGAFLILIGFCPKFSALLISIPQPIAGAYVLVLLVLLFLHGLRLVAEGGLDYEKGMIVCVSFWLAVGFQNQTVFHDHLPEWTRGLLDNGMTSGGIIAVVLTFLVSLRHGRPRRLQVPGRTGSIPEVQAFVRGAGQRAGWDKEAVSRLELASEEALLFLIGDPDGGEDTQKRVRVSAAAGEKSIELEFLGFTDNVDLENIAGLVDWNQPPTADDAGLRILHGLCDSVRHEQFHGADVLILSLESRPL